MKKIFLSLILGFLLSCGSTPETKSINTAAIVDIDSLNPYKIVSSSTDELMLNVYEGLFKPSVDNDVELALAKSLEISEDNLTYIFEIRDDVYFHNGTKLEMDDVEFSINKMRELALQSSFLNIENVEVENNKLIIKLKNVDSSFIYYLTTAIVDKQTFDNIDKVANGTGPYYVSNYQRQQKLELKKFDKYYGEKPNIDIVNIDILPNFETSFLKLISGEYNFLSGINSKRVEEIKDKQIVTRPRNMMFIMGINNKLFGKDIRRALNAGIDKEHLIKQTTNNYAKKIGQDEKANMIVLNDLEMTLTVPVNDVIYVDAAQVIKEHLSKYGLKININAVEWSTWLQEVYGKRNYELTLIGFTGKLDKDATYRRYLSDYSKNFINFNNAKYDELIKQAKITIDKEKRDELYSRAEKILFDEQASVFIMDPQLIVAMDKNIKGYVPYNIPFINFAKLKIED